MVQHVLDLVDENEETMLYITFSPLPCLPRVGDTIQMVVNDTYSSFKVVDVLFDVIHNDDNFDISVNVYVTAKIISK